MMHDDVTVTAADIARLADVGRAAVSNWRKRFDDFPQPVGGTASSPAFSLAEVEEWLRRHNRYVKVTPLERVWQRLRGTADDIRLGEVVGHAGMFLLYLARDAAGWRGLSRLTDAELAERLPEALAAAVPEVPGGPPDGPALDPDLIRALAELAAERGPAAVFDEICDRYVEVHSRRVFATPREVAEVMAALGDTAGRTVLDPACGVGTMLLAAGAARALGQEVNPSAARLSAVRLLLHGTDAVIHAGDSLRADAFPGVQADVVVCNPPFNDRTWGYEELTSDPRWEYGLPPRGESELAWVQHCLAHVRPGGLVIIMMPGVAASRRSGRRVRGNLLRAGALRAVMTLPTGAAPASSGAPDLWILRRPEPGDRPPSDVLMVDASADPALAATAWRAYAKGAELPETARPVRIIDLLDEEVDLTPARRLTGPAPAEPAAFTELRERAAAALAKLDLPRLAPPPQPRSLPLTSVGELARAGVVTILQGPPKPLPAGGAVPVLTVQDLMLGRAPTGRTGEDPGLIAIEPGDVVVPLLLRGDTVARVISEPGAVLGPQLLLLRADPDRLDPYFLAGCLRATAESSTRLGSSVRMDPRRARLPRLPLDEQRAYGDAFRRLLAFEDALRGVAALGGDLVRLGFGGLLEGTLQPE